VQTQDEFSFYVNGIFKLDIQQLRLEPDCGKLNQTRNSFLVVEDQNTHDSDDVLQPMRGEITQVYLLNKNESEEAVVRSFYECGPMGTGGGENAAFDWSKVDWRGTGLEGVRRRRSGFCKGCEQPEMPKYSAINYEGVQVGDVRAYKCIRGFDIVGYANSVCMVYGEWSHRTPRCKSKSRDWAGLMNNDGV